MSSSGTLYWLQPRWWVKTLVSSLLPRRCSFPQRAPGCPRKPWSSAWAWGAGGWARFRGGCCRNGSRRRSRCRWTLPCWEGQGRGLPGRQGIPRLLLARLQVPRRTSARHCGCWRRYWTECCCWSDWSTESRPAEDTRTKVRRGREGDRWTNETRWRRVWPSSVCLESLSLGCPVWWFSSARLHRLVPETPTPEHARGVLGRETHPDTGLKQITLNPHGWQRGLNTYITFKHWPPPTHQHTQSHGVIFALLSDTHKKPVCSSRQKSG